MNRPLAWTILIGLVAGCLLAGCDKPPAPLKTPDGEVVRAVTIDDNDPAELEAVKAAEGARADYIYRLEVLKSHYRQVGNMDKFTDSCKELKNLKEAQYFRWLGIEVTQPQSQPAQPTDERLLVEEALTARKAWLKSMNALAALLAEKGSTFKARLVENALERFDPAYRYSYFLEAEIPGPELRPTEVFPEADELYARALRLHRQGKGFFGPFTTSYRLQIKALVLFRELIQKYPRSNKIALSAYYIAEIYKEYRNENVRAVKWYERAWQWDPQVTEPARFQAATVYDFRLKEPAKAAELYRKSITEDPWRWYNREFARDRIKVLSGQGGK